MKTFSVHWKNKRPTEIPNAVSKREQDGNVEFLDAEGRVIAKYSLSVIVGVQESDDGRTPEDDIGCWSS